MKKLPTYNEQFNKITEAYIKGEIRPYEANFCFCGTLCNNDSSWFMSSGGEGKGYGAYSHKELKKMEKAVLCTLAKLTLGIDEKIPSHENMERIKEHLNYETALFNGMVAALEELKQIHIERGEVIDQAPVFIKRELATSQH